MTEHATDFGDAHAAAAWCLHSEGGGVCAVDGGVLKLDLSKPVAGKHAWADLQRTLKLPVTVEWDQKTARVSPHFYLSGLTLRDARDTMIVAGLTGDSMKRVVHMAGKRGTQTLAAGSWYRFVLRVSADKQAELTVTARDTGREVAVLSGRLTQLRGPLAAIGFYHNQPRLRGPDRFAQDRGASWIDNVRVRARAIDRRSMRAYRDPDTRGYDSRTTMTFNRTMRWLGPEEGVEGAVLAYDAAREVFLTGSGQAASWQVNRGCSIEPKDARASTFTRPNDLDGPDAVAVRSFQWCVKQHPVLRYDLRPAAGACWLKVTFVCPYLGDGIEVFRCQPGSEAQQGTVDLLAEMARRGLGYHQFGEIGVFVYQERPVDTSAPCGSCDVVLRLTGDGALLTTPPLVRTSESVAEGVNLHAVLALPDGSLGHGNDVTVSGEVAGRPLSFSEVGDTGVFRTRLRGVGEGEHTVRLKGSGGGGRLYRNQLSLTVLPRSFVSWRAGQPTYQLPDGRVLPTQFGDLLAWVPVLDPSSPQRHPIASTRQWKALTEAERERVRLIKLRTLNPAEIACMLRAHADSGFGVIRLTPNVSPHESYLDAGGHVSMHGLETLLAVLAECRRTEIRALINLFHYPYRSPGTGGYAPWRQYADAGYAGPGSFHDPAVSRMLRRYLGELLLFLRDDPAVLGYSLTGENDQTHGSDWINSMFDHVMACDPNHMVTQEQGGGAERCSGGTPWGYDAFRPTKSAGLGYRTYYTGGLPSDAYFMVCGRFYGANPPVFVAEVASGPGWHGGFVANWLHPDFVTKVRDTCWASLLTQQTMCLTWSAPWTQEERLVPRRCAGRLDWSKFRRERPSVGLLLERVDPQVLKALGEYEAALARLGVDYDYVWAGRTGQAVRERYALLLDAGKGFAEPELPPEVLAARPVVASDGYSVSYLASAEPAQLIAYVKNTGEYRLGPGYGRGVKELHRQRTRPAPLRVRLRPFPAVCSYVVHDVDDRRVIREGPCGRTVDLALGRTAHDFAIVVAP